MADLTGVDPELAMRIQALINASNGRIHIESGYRTRDQQAKLYAAEPNLAAPPGHSNHERGEAVDLGGDYALIGRLAPQFGLVLPMSWEPWHLELPGTRNGGKATPSSYTISPYGDANPVGDQNIDRKPETIFATAASAMRELSALGAVPNPMGEMTGLPEQQGVNAASNAVSQPSPTSGAGRAVPVPGGGGGSVEPGELYKMLRGQGLDPVHAAALVAIAGRESGYDPSAHNGNAATGDNSYGLFQINLLGGMHSQFTPQQLTTAQGSAQAAASLVKSGGLQPWGPYKGQSWSYGTNLAAAAAATGGEVSLAQLEAITNEGLH